MTPFARPALYGGTECRVKPCTRMEKCPEFVREEAEPNRRGVALTELTGWENVVFEVTDAQEPDSESVFSTASLAP